jgi:threonine dehydrogenase-like Zn-dependent dehydrogenase
MRAIQIKEPKKIVMMTDAPIPEPADGEVQVKCSHIALCGSNMGQYTGIGLWANIPFPNPIGWAGHENIGIITKSRHPDWKEGTLVLAQPEGYFGFAEYIVCRPPAIARLPHDTPDPGALIVAQPLATILRALDRTDGKVFNKTCAVVGQGSMGLVFTHILRLLGARSVIAVDKLAWRLEWSKRFHADAVIDASKENVVETVTELTKGEKVDFVVDAAGEEDSLQNAAMIIKKYGRLLLFGMPDFDLLRFPWYHVFRANIQINTCVGPECGAYFQTAANMVLDERASCLTSMVTPRMPWDKAPEAFELYAACEKDILKLTLEL